MQKQPYNPHKYDHLIVVAFLFVLIIILSVATIIYLK